MKTVQQVIQIGDWELYPTTNQIKNNQIDFFLKPRLMRLFVFLIEHPNRIVTKAELMGAVWEDRIITDNLLTKSISELRQVIQIHFSDLMQIKTIRSVGYELSFFHQKEKSAPNRLMSKLPDERKAKKKKPRLFAKLIAGVVVMFLIALCWKIFPVESAPSNFVSKIKFSPITSTTGIEWQAAISPKGTNLVYAWRKDQAPSFYLYTRHLESALSKRLTTQEGRSELNPVWSPDGQKIAFLRLRKGGQYDLQMIPLAGGEEVSIARFEFYLIKPNLLWDVFQNQLIFSGKKTAAAPLSIFSFDLETKQFHQLTFPSDDLYGDYFPNLLPDRRLIFVRSNFGKSVLNVQSPGNSEIIQLDLETGKEQTLVDFEKEVTGMVYSKPLKKLVAWLTKQEGYEYELQGFQLDGTPGLITSVQTHRPSNLLAHPQSPFLIYEAWASLLNIHLVEQEGLNPFLHSTHWDWHPRFSKTGQKIAFLSSRNGATQIWLNDKNHPEFAIPVSNFESPAIHWISLSPDGEMVILQGAIRGKEGIYKLETKTKKLSPLKEGNETFAHPEFSPNGQLIYYASNKSGDWQIWRCNLEGKAEEKITENGGYKASLLDHSEGSFLFYVPFKGTGLWRMDLQTQQIKQLFPDEEPIDKMNFAVTNTGIYYFGWEPGQCYLKYFDFEQNTFEKIMPLDGIVPGVPSLAVGIDSTILISSSDKINADLLKIEIGK